MQIRASGVMDEWPTIRKKEEKRNQRIVFALCCILFLPAINNFINSILQIGLLIRLEYLTPVVYIFMAFVSGFLLYPYIFRRKSFLVLFLLIFLGVVVSYTIYPEIRNVIYGSPVDLVYSPVNKLFVYCIPSLIGIACLTDYGRFFDAMHKWGRFTALLGIATYIFVFFYMGRELQYMVYSYFMLLPICVCCEKAKEAESKLDWLIVLGGAVCIIMCGARGAVVSLIMYFVLGFVLGISRRMTRGKALQLILLLLVLLAVIFFYDQILSAVADLFKALGINSRFIYYLSEHALLEDSGRSSITEAVFAGIRSNPMGYGIYGDRYVTGAFGLGSHRYAHNLIWEWLCDFGVIGGSLMLWILARGIWKTFSVLEESKEKGVMLALVPYGIFQLFFSSSFLENIPFFLIVGMAFFVRWQRSDM